MRNLVIILFTVWSGVVFGQTNISGFISSNTAWTTAGNPYTITGNTVVNSGVQLTIEPGVLVKFNANRSLLINGTMQAVGTETDTIVFTANQSNSQPGFWGQITFSDMSMDYDSLAGTGNLMQYCKVEYGGGQGANGNIYLENSSILIEHSKICLSALDGIQGFGVGTTVTAFRNNQIVSNLENGISLQPGSNSQPIGDFIIHTNQISFNGGAGVKAEIEGLWAFDYNSSVNVIQNEIIGNNDGIRYLLVPNNLIQSNTIRNNTDNGIYTSFTGGTKVANNLISESRIGINCFVNVQVERNLVSDCDSIGIWTGNCTINRNLCVSNYIGISARTSHFGKPDTISSNIIVGSDGRCAMSISPYEPNADPYYARNILVDNSCSSFVVEFVDGEEYQSMVYNTIVRNSTTNFNNTAAVSYNLTGTSQTPLFNGNNIYNNGNVNGTDIEMRSNDQMNINAQNCYWGTTVEQEIEDVVYHFIDNSNLAFVDYSNFQTTPDTTAPVTPPRNVSKVNLGNGQIKLCWNSNLEVDLAGYRVYYGNPTGYSFSNFIDVGNVNTYTISGVNINDSIAITAYDIFANEFEDQFDGNESWFTYAEDATLNTNFSYNANGLTVDFNLLATNADTVSWDFGDGTTANQENPQHSFATADTYNVCLTVGNGCAGLETVCQQVAASCSGSFDLTAVGTLEFCDGDSVLLEAQSGLTDYNWNTSATSQSVYVSQEGDYYTSAMFGGCEYLSDTISVSVITVEPTIEDNGDDLTCPETYVSYQWYLNDTIIQGATGQTITAQSSGNYTVEVVDDNGCIGTSYTLEFTLQTGITEDGTNVPFSVYPNPNNGMFRLDMQEAKPYSVEVFNALGQLVFNQRYAPRDVATIELTSEGVYHLSVFIEDAVYVLKVVKK